MRPIHVFRLYLVGARSGDLRIRRGAAGRPPLGRSTVSAALSVENLALMRLALWRYYRLLRVEWIWKNENGRENHGAR